MTDATTDDGHDHAARRQRRTETHLAFVAAGLIALGACAAAVATTPTGSGHPTVALIVCWLLAVAAVGPLARGARPAQVWRCQTVGTLLLAASVLAAWMPLSWGPVAPHDLLECAGRILLITWLVKMAIYLGRPHYHYVPFLDVIAVVSCAVLWMWPLLLVPLMGTHLLGVGLVQTCHVVLEAIVLTMSIEVLYQVRRVTTSHRLLLWGLSLSLALAPVTSVLAVHPDALPAGTDAARLVPLLILLGAAWHPSVRHFSERPERGEGRKPSAGTVSLTMGNTVPIVVAVVIPTHGTIDLAIRVTCITIILGSLAVRLWGTMRALAAAETDSHHRASHDHLTGLLNRAALFDGLDRVLTDNTAAGRHTAALFADCDDFKHVNDRWGHHSGDRLLVAMAERMLTHPGPLDLVARHGGDEFVVITTVESPQEAVALARWMSRALTEPVTMPDAVSYRPTSSIGVAVAAPDGSTTPDDLIRRADTAMYLAKSRGPGSWVLAGDESPLASGDGSDTGTGNDSDNNGHHHHEATPA